jgi:hypothetical protein
MTCDHGKPPMRSDGPAPVCTEPVATEVFAGNVILRYCSAHLLEALPFITEAYRLSVLWQV